MTGSRLTVCGESYSKDKAIKIIQYYQNALVVDTQIANCLMKKVRFKISTRTKVLIRDQNNIVSIPYRAVPIQLRYFLN